MLLDNYHTLLSGLMISDGTQQLWLVYDFFLLHPATMLVLQNSFFPLSYIYILPPLYLTLSNEN